MSLHEEMNMKLQPPELAEPMGEIDMLNPAIDGSKVLPAITTEEPLPQNIQEVPMEGIPQPAPENVIERFEGTFVNPNYDDPKTAGFRRTRNYQTAQQGVFIGLLNTVYNITIDHPRKKSKITLPFYTIVKISTDKEVVEVKEIMSYRLQHLHDQDVTQGCSEKTAARRQEVYRVTEQLHILMNLMRDIGFEVESKKTTGNKGTPKETARKIRFNDFVFDREYIEERGNLINELLLRKLDTVPKSSELTIHCGDQDIANVLKLGTSYPYQPSK